MSVLRAFAVLLVLFGSLPAAAQVTAQVIPANPTIDDQVFLRISPGSIFITGKATRTGNHFRVDLDACPIVCLEELNIPLGRLAPGAYTFEVFLGRHLLTSGSFAVSGPEIPALSPAALAALAVLLAAGGWLLIGRRT